MHFKIFVKDIQDGGLCMFDAQIVAQTRDIFAIWKSVPISNINHYHKTHLVHKLWLKLGIFSLYGKVHPSLTLITTTRHLEYSMKTDVDLNH